MKTWNVPELNELSINATAGGHTFNEKNDGPAVWDETLVNPKTGKKGNWWEPKGVDHGYEN